MNKGSITRLIEKAKQGDEISLQALFKRFHLRMLQWAYRELDPTKCRDFDTDDIAMEAFHSFYLGIIDEKFPNLDDRHSVQALLATITIRKAINQIEKSNAKKRGAGNVRGESAFENMTDSGNIQESFESVESEELSPDEQLILDDEIDHSLRLLPENLRETARQLLMGDTPREISKKQHRSTRMIEIQRKRIFDLWRETVE